MVLNRNNWWRSRGGCDLEERETLEAEHLKVRAVDHSHGNVSIDLSKRMPMVDFRVD